MLIRAVVILSLTFAISTHAQRKEGFQVLVGPDLPYKKKSTLRDIIGSDESGFYTSRANMLSWKMNLVSYNPDLKETNNTLQSLKWEGKTPRFEDLIYFKDHIYLLTSEADKATRTNHLYVQSVNKETLLLNKDRRSIATIDFSNETKKNSGTFDYEISRDKTKLLIYYNLPYNRGEAEKFGFKVFNEKFDLVWSKQVTLPYLDELSSVETFEVSNSGNVYVLLKKYNEKAKRERKGKVNYTYHILGYSADNESLDLRVENEGKYFTDMTINVDDNDQVVCAGFYSEDLTFNLVGSYFIKLSGETQKRLVESFKEFDLDFLIQNFSEKAKKRAERRTKKGKDIAKFNYELDGIILRDDGGAVVVGEQYYISEHITTDSNGNVRVTYVYHYNDIIVVSIDPLGQIEWNQKIPKSQRSGSTMFSSYVVAVHEDKLHFAFNDNPLNVHIASNVEPYPCTFGKGKTSVSMVTLDTGGNQKRQSLFSTKDTGILLRPTVSRQISDSSLLLYGQRKAAHRFVSIVFE